MAEYGLSFDYIERHWTDRQFALFTRRLEERMKRQTQQRGDGRTGKPGTISFADYHRQRTA